MTSLRIEELKAELARRNQSIEGNKLELTSRLKTLLKGLKIPFAQVEKEYIAKRSTSSSSSTTAVAVSDVTEETTSSGNVAPRSSGNLTVFRTKTSDNWETVELPDSEVKEQGEGYEDAVGAFREEDLEFVKLVDDILVDSRRTHPEVSSNRVLLFLWFIQGIAELIVSESRKIGLNISGEELCKVIGSLFVLCTSTLSSHSAWVELLANKTDLAFTRFNEVLHRFVISTPDRVTKDSATWQPKDIQDQAFRRATERLNCKFGLFARAAICFDDDIENSVSMQAQKGEVALACVVRKNGWCATWDTICSVVDGIPIFTQLRETGGAVMEKFINSFGFFGGEFLYHDRYYTHARHAKVLRDKNVSGLGPTKGSLKGSHPFDVISLKKWNTPHNVAVGEERSCRGIRSVETYNGVGPSIFAARSKTARVLSITVLNRTNDSNDGIIQFIGANANGPCKALDLQNMCSFVRIHKPIPPDEKRNNIIVASETDGDAKFILNRIESMCDVISQVQGDAGWGISRHLTFTASQAASAVKRILRWRMGFPLVRAALFETSASSSPDSVDPAPPEPEHAEATEVDAVDNSQTVVWSASEHFPVEESRGDSTESTGIENNEDDEERPGEELEQELSQNMEDPENTATNVESENVASDTAEGDEAHHDDISSTQSQGSEDEEIEHLRKNFHGLASTLLLYKKTKAMKMGTLTEPEILKFARKLSCVKRNQIFTIGLTRHKEILYAGCSLDGVFMHAVSNEPVIFEAKLITDVNFHKNVHSAKQVETVLVGSAEYFRLVPSQYRVQLLQQAAVTGIRFVLLCIAARDGPNSSVLVEYDAQTLQEYLMLLKQRSISDMFDWFYSPMNRDLSNAQVLTRLPSAAPPEVIRILKSHIRIIRAVHRYRQRIGRPIPPTKTFRFGIVNAYDIGKAGVDGFCKDISQAMGHPSITLQWRQLAVVRYIYMATVASLKVWMVYDYLGTRSRDRAGESLADRRRNLRKKATRMSDQCHGLGKELLAKTVNLTLAPDANSPRVSSASPRVQGLLRELTSSDLLCAYPDRMLEVLQTRATRFGRTASRLDVYKGLPMDVSMLYTSSPSTLMSEPLRERLEDIIPSVLKLRDICSRKRTRGQVDFWGSEDGKKLRLCRQILHPKVPCSAVRSECQKCGYRKTTSTKKTEELCISFCGMCGVRLCGTCFEAFHSQLSGHLDSRGSSSSAGSAQGTSGQVEALDRRGSSSSAGSAQGASGQVDAVGPGRDVVTVDRQPNFHGHHDC